MSREYLPSLKGTIIKELYGEFGLNQEKIAEAMGLTQAAVSKYLSGKYLGARKNSGNKEIARKAKEIAKEIAIGKAGRERVSLMVCKCCDALLGTEKACKISSRKVN
jgi:predicted transcriptional regulator